MQDKYISLDPTVADSQSSMVRQSLYWQRLNEAAGGPAAGLVASQVATTAYFVSYASLRQSGFRFFPVCASKVPKYGGLLLCALLGWNYGSTFVFSQLGDKEQYNYLVANKSAIVNGQKNMN